MVIITVGNACCTVTSINDRSGAVWLSFFLMLLFALMALPAHAADEKSESQTTMQSTPMGHGNPIANYWRTVRSGTEGITTESGPYTTNTLIQNGGQNWRQIRNGLIANYGGWVIGIIAAIIVLFFLVRGRIRIDEGQSDKRVMRFTLWQRIVHWYAAVTFILLALSGLVMMFGRALLIPMLGKDAFSVLAELSKTVHNYTGPLFVIGILMLIVTFVAGNAFRKGDLQWFKQGGGMKKGRHASAGRYNPGEKAWFWIAALGGLTVMITGVILDFPGFGQTREIMQVSEIIHASIALLFIAASFGHIYIGTVGTEGAIDGMTKGHVDANWAKQHHDRWYEEMEKSGMVKKAEELEAEKTLHASTGVTQE